MDDPNRTLERIGAALHAGDRVAVTSCFAADATLVVMSGEDRIAFTRIGIGDAVDALMTGFDDLRLTLTSRLVSKALVVEEAVVSGNHTGNFAGTGPTSRRVCVNVRLSTTWGTWGPDSTLQSLLVQGDTRALFAQIAGTDDVIGVTGGLNAIARERHDRALHHTDGTNPPRWRTSASGGTALLSTSRRRWGVATVAVLLLAAVLIWRGGSTAGHQEAHPVAPSRLAATTAASTTQRARPARTALPAIARADPKVVPKVQAGKQVVLRSDVLFAFDSAALTPAASTALTHLAQQVRHTNVTGTIQVNGYTDNLGSIDYDLALSRTRALAVAGVLQRALVGLHVTLIPQGFGHANPIAPNTSGTGRARNRRVTIVLPVPR